MTRPFGRTRVSGSNRRKVGWSVGPGGTSLASAVVSGSAIVGSLSSATTDGLTLVRTRGRAIYKIQSFNAAGDAFTGAFGIGIVTAEAAAVGITAMPIPITDSAWDGWLFHTYLQLVAGDKTAGDVDFTAATQIIDIDSKSMRKMRAGDTLYMAHELVETGTVDMDFVADSRVLFKLP